MMAEIEEIRKKLNALIREYNQHTHSKLGRETLYYKVEKLEEEG